MQIDVNFLENLKLEATFDDYKILTDQPVRYKGDGLAPSPFDFFLSSSALCAAYFAKVYCKARGIPTEDIRVSQNNIVDPENRYKQSFHIKIELPASLPEKDREGILRSMERCTVKKVIQEGPEFIIEAVDTLGTDHGIEEMFLKNNAKKTRIPGKDWALEDTIAAMTSRIEDLGINLEIASWRNIVPNVWSVHLRDADSPLCYTNGKGATKEAALCSALGEYMERLACNYFYNDYYLGDEITKKSFVHYPNEKWFAIDESDAIPIGLLDEYTRNLYNPADELLGSHLIDTNSGLKDRGICALPFQRLSDDSTVYFPVNLIGNLFVSNGMSAGNTLEEARVQCLSEIFERAVKKEILEEELALPDVPAEVLSRYPSIVEGIKELESKGYPVLVKDASLGGRFPVMCVTLMNPKTGGVYASFGAHPRFEVALERSLTELLQGRSFEGLNDMPAPTFRSEAVLEPNNFVEHFIDSTGVVSWKFFSAESDYEFVDWDFSGSTKEEETWLFYILREMGKEVYVANYTDLVTPACRILVPGYSEIYPVDDLVWENHNRALDYRNDILQIHRLSADKLTALLDRLEENGLDNYMKVSELIGVEFEDTSTWGQLDIGELKLLGYMALGQHEQAKELVEGLIVFNESSHERRMFYQALDAALHVTITPELQIEHFLENFRRMFGSELIEAVCGSIDGSVKFFGLQETDLALNNVDKHQKLVASYKKLHAWREQNR